MLNWSVTRGWLGVVVWRRWPIVVLVQSIYELSIQPVLWPSGAVAASGA